MDPDGLFARRSGVAFVIVLSSSEGLRPVFGEAHWGGGGVKALVFDGFVEFFFLVLEFHLKGNFDILCIEHINIGDSFEFLQVKEETPLLVFGSLLSKFLELFLIVEEELLLFGLFGLDAFDSALADVHEFGKLPLYIYQRVFGFDQFVAEVADIAQTLLFHVRDVLKLLVTILQMRNQLIYQLISYKLLHLVLCVKHPTQTAHYLVVVFRRHLYDLLLSSYLPQFCLGL